MTTYRYNPLTKEVEECGATYDDAWVNTGIRYGSETLAMMKKKGLVPPTDFTKHWEKKRRERDLILTVGGTPEMHEERKRDINEAIEKLKVRGKY